MKLGNLNESFARRRHHSFQSIEHLKKCSKSDMNPRVTDT